MIQVQLKLRLRPAQERQLERWLYRLTGVWNWAIRKLEQDGNGGVRYSLFDFKALLYKHSTRVGMAAKALSGMAAQAHTAYGRYRDGIARRPRLKGRRNRLNSIPIDEGREVRGQSIRIPVLGVVRFHKQEIPDGHIGQMRLVKRASGWYLCLFIHADPRAVPALLDGEVGIDSGFTNLLTTSSGETIEHPRELEAAAVRLAQAQRGKRANLAARINERIGNQHRNRNHHVSRRLVSENHLIAWSKDRTKNIARKFGKSVSSSSHYQLRSMLAYKSRIGGREYIEVDSRNSTRTCSACGALTGPTGWHGLKVRFWDCGACGAHHERDVNAAQNTLKIGLRTSHERRREASSGISMIQDRDVRPRETRDRFQEPR
jgi:putative transposase